MSGDNVYLDAEQDLLGGIESGISRGQTLKEAMVSLYNSGYEKAEIENAARAYLDIVNRKKAPGVFPNENLNAKKEEPKKEESTDLKKTKSLPTTPSKSDTKSPQVVSSYGQEQEKNKKKEKKSKFKLKDNSQKERDPNAKEELRNKAATYILIAILVLLLLALAAVFLFKDELVRFINNLFG